MQIGEEGEKTVEIHKATESLYYDPIPLDLTREILLRLPARSLVRFRCISKLWSSLTTKVGPEQCVMKYLQQTPEIFEEIDIILQKYFLDPQFFFYIDSVIGPPKFQGRPCSQPNQISSSHSLLALYIGLVFFSASVNKPRGYSSHCHNTRLLMTMTSVVYLRIMMM